MEDKIVLTEPENEELRMGQALYEMTQTPGFKVLLKKLEDVAYHSWADPRETDRDQWIWRETLTWAAATNARELIEWIQQSISRSEYLHKKKLGEISVRPMKI